MTSIICFMRERLQHPICEEPAESREDEMQAVNSVWLLGEYKSVLADSHNLLSGVNVSTD